MVRTKAPPTKLPATNADGTPIKTEVITSNGILGKAVDKKPRRWKSGTVAMREIRRYQKNVDLLIQRAPMARTIRGIDAAIHGSPHWFKTEAVDAIHTAAEAYLQDIFKKTIAVAVNRNAQTIRVKDMKLVALLKD
jgi:histone H3/H4